jgi:hypothetical protein
MFKPIKALDHLSSHSRLVFILTVGVSLASAIAYASIPDANGVVHGCYKKSGGMLRVIDSAADQCDKSETPLTWNQTGPQGLQGPPGPPGSQGPPGQTVQLTTHSGSGLSFIPCNSVEETAPVHSVPFTKATSTSRLRIGYSDVVFVQLGVDETFAKQLSIFGYAENVSEGSHTLTVTYKIENPFPPSSGRLCYRGNPYPINRSDPFQIEIEEIP